MKTLQQVDLHTALTKRCTSRSYNKVTVEQEVLLEVLWAGVGKNREAGGRTAPMPMRDVIIRVYVASKDGVELYDGDTGHLTSVSPDDVRSQIARQEFVPDASHVLIITGLFKNYKDKVNDQKRNDWTWATAGTVCQNIALGAAAHGLGTVLIVSIHEEEISKLLPLQDGERPIIVMPLGE
ncbi:nitroreductase family protein [Desulforhopalus sp. 52FAK]